MKITLLAKPNVPEEVVKQTAKAIKYSEICEMKLKQYQMHAKKHGKKEEGKKGKKKKSDKSESSKDKKKDSSKKTDSSKKKDEKKDKEKQKDSPPDQEPQIVVTEKELELDYLDLYPAEMVYWRSVAPYYINTNFTCHVTYEFETPKIHKKPDKLYLEAFCKVVRPDFSTNLNLQRLSFGNCLIGMTVSKHIMLQNITYQDIKPRVSLFNPLGSFSLPHIQDLTLPPEHYLKVPIDFRPISAGKGGNIRVKVMR